MTGPMEEPAMTESAVIFQEIKTRSKDLVGVATLNAPKNLNAISMEMIDGLYRQLEDWRQNDHVVCIFLQGAGDKAFCAGGDIISLYESMINSRDGTNEYAEKFFSNEYRLDYLIHNYPKPIICWGHGFIMGGGLGLMAGASHRVVTETAKIAMPEIAIGLFPDVGATWFFNRMPDTIGLFLGLTGLDLNAEDALRVHLADVFIPVNQKEKLWEGLKNLPWNRQASNHFRVSQLLRQISRPHEDQRPESRLAPHLPFVRDLGTLDSLEAVYASLMQTHTDDDWLKKGLDSLREGCPTTACLVWRQTHQLRGLPLKEVFRQELIMAIQCTRHPDFREGVRAQLIDKDKHPQWQHDSPGDVPETWVNEFFDSPWQDGSHPLKDL